MKTVLVKIRVSRMLPEVDSIKEYFQGQKEEYCAYNSTSALCCNPTRCQAVHLSSLASICCGTPPPKWPLLISGTPRSGTVFVQEALVDMGLRVSTDWKSPRQDGMVSWIHLFSDLSYFGPARLNGGRFEAISHLVRDPLKSLTSIAFSEPIHRPEYQKYLQRHIPLETNAPSLKTRPQRSIYFALQFYVSWHEFLDSLRVPRFRLEDFSPNVVHQIYQGVDMQVNKTRVSCFFNSPKQETVKNHRGHRATLQWSELCAVNQTLTETFWKLSRSYGYFSNWTQSPCR